MTSQTARLCGLIIYALCLTSSGTAQQNSPGARSTAPLTNQDIVLMTRSKFDDATIVKTIQTFNTNFDLSVAALMKLKEAGVSESVMQAMLAKANDVSKALSPEYSSSSVTTVSPHSPSLPKEAATKLQPGTYYWTGGAWHSMEQINMSGGGAKHMAKMFLPGLTPQMVWTFRDPQAPVQIKEGMPLFCFKFIAMQPRTPYAPSGRDIVIARFDQKRDHRELQTTSGGNMFTFKSGLSKDRMPDIGVTELDSSTYLVAPKVALVPGEYLLSSSSIGISGFDFGFHPSK